MATGDLTTLSPDYVGAGIGPSIGRLEFAVIRILWRWRKRKNLLLF
jgi:hypothetical protein